MDLESKDILAKLKAEGLDWAHNHMSTLTYGQAETVKEWYRSGQLGSGKSAGEEEESAEISMEESSKSRTARKSKHSAEEGGDVLIAEPPTETFEPEEPVVEKAPAITTHAPVAEKEPEARPAAPSPAIEAPPLKLTPQIV